MHTQVINYESVPFSTIASSFNTGVWDSIERGFVRLMGFRNSNIGKIFKNELYAVISSFVSLSRKFYFIKPRLLANNPNSLSLSVYDFSNFFRLYPLLKRYISLEDQEGIFLNTIIVNNKSINNYDEYFNDRDTYSETKFLNRHIYKKFAPFMVHQRDTNKIASEILPFLKQYDYVHSLIMKHFSLDMKKIEADAYYINEDRKYLFASNKFTYLLAQRYNLEEAQHMNRLMNELILSNYRNFHYTIKNKLPTNIHVYWQGVSCILMDGKGFMQIYLSIFDSSHLAPRVEKNKVGLFFQNEMISFNSARHKGDKSYTIISNKIKNEYLLENKSLHFSKDYSLSLTYNSCLVPFELLFCIY